MRGHGTRHRRRRRLQKGLFEYGDKLVHEIVARMLLIVAIIVLVDTTLTFVTYHPFSAEAAMAAVADVMVAIIIVEIMSTIKAPSDNKGLRRLQAFLVIGIISAVREVLATSADLSLKPQSAAASSNTVLLLVSAGVVVCLTASLVLVRRLGGTQQHAAHGS
jgi:uncharacterized membrane protein (DUF373 family)